MHSRFFITFDPPRATLYLAGEFDLTERAELHRRIEDAIALGCVRLEVDSAAVTFIDAGCLRELDAGRVRLAKLGRSLVVRRTSPVFERVVTLSGYPGLLTEHQTSGVSAPVTAPDGRTTFRRPRPLDGTRPTRSRLPRAAQQPVASPHGRADGA
jgi:anti-anti-sigma regulatory factor